MNRHIKQLARLFLGVFWVCACTAQGTPPQPQYPSEFQYQDMGYPGFTNLHSTADWSSLSCLNDLLSDSGLGSIRGGVYQKSQRAVLSDMLIYLTPAQGNNKDLPPPVLAGPLKEKGDIAGKTDENGCFYFNNIPPGNYFLVVAFGYDYDIAVKSLEDTTPLLIHLEPNQQLSLGVVIIP
jgi:hypothetical protein